MLRYSLHLPIIIADSHIVCRTAIMADHECEHACSLLYEIGLHTAISSTARAYQQLFQWQIYFCN